jgi:beta-glucosidase/6-phospho-beta-glucosidase/beta-galactosidase
MLRRVAFTKASAAGATGALAWALVARLLIWLGVPLFDLVHVLGTMLLPGNGDVRARLWWPAGLALHAAVGAIWAIFYAYFFWSNYRWKPVAQGLVFSLLPAALAGLVMVPQMGWMHPKVLVGEAAHPGLFARKLGWGGPAGIILGHLVFGATLGALYTRPVGYRADRRCVDHAPPPRRRRAASVPDDAESHDERFMFATGIECSNPTIENGRWRVDELHETDHYRHWHRDLELVRELGLSHLRYGPPLHCTWPGPDRYDWSFTDDVLAAMRELRIEPIMDLCHFGLPRWLGDFQNREFGARFGDYAAAFARRYPWVRLYTPVNEMYVTAKMSALDGVWNEQLRSERGFVNAVANVVAASQGAARAIAREQPQALLVNSESSEFFQACCPDAHVVAAADFENTRRFIALDLFYGMEPGERVRDYLFDHGVSAAEYEAFMREGRSIADRCVLGIDYYEWNEKLINTECRAEALGELFGWYVITRQYYDRYHRPLMHTETNCQDARDAPDWLWRQWHNVQLMRRNGVPVLGFTWYSLIDQVDWNIGLSRPLGNVNPVGLFDVNRDPRPVAHAYHQLVHMFADEPLVPGGAVRRRLFDVVTENGGVSSHRSYERTDTSPAQPSVPR